MLARARTGDPSTDVGVTTIDAIDGPPSTISPRRAWSVPPSPSLSVSRTNCTPPNAGLYTNVGPLPEASTGPFGKPARTSHEYVCTSSRPGSFDTPANVIGVPAVADAGPTISASG